ncbi:hypothetical protein [Streptomyces tubercidicus]|uniref:hypothetical protein n=1 Tax=Streptomyces tubercidicus TaxID=47759 RepID=UPI0036C12F8E
MDQHALSDTDAASSALHGWRTADALGALHRRWAEEAVNLTKLLSNATMKLHNTSNSYEETDHAEQSRMDSLGSGRNWHVTFSIGWTGPECRVRR